MDNFDNFFDGKDNGDGNGNAAAAYAVGTSPRPDTPCPLKAWLLKGANTRLFSPPMSSVSCVTGE